MKSSNKNTCDTCNSPRGRKDLICLHCVLEVGSKLLYRRDFTEANMYVVVCPVCFSFIECPNLSIHLRSNMYYIAPSYTTINKLVNTYFR